MHPGDSATRCRRGAVACGARRPVGSCASRAAGAPPAGSDVSAHLERNARWRRDARRHHNEIPLAAGDLPAARAFFADWASELD